MSINIEKYYGKPSPNSFSEILDQYSIKEINSIKTSTVPFLNYWKNGEEKISCFLSSLGIKSNPHTIAFEYPTRSYKSNKASMTDLMVFCDNWKIAIEAKFTEVKYKYETISSWNKKKSINRSCVISHWIELLEPFVDSQLTEELIPDIPYQFFHRIASSCADNNESACTVFQLFYERKALPKLNSFINTLSSSAKQLKPKSNLKIFIQKIETHLISPNIDKDNVLQYLKENEIYRFGEENFIQLSP